MPSNGSSVEIGMRGLAEAHCDQDMARMFANGWYQIKITDWIMWNTTPTPTISTGPMNKSYSGELDQTYPINSLSLKDTSSFDWSRTG